MDQSNNPNTPVPLQASRPAPRDMMYCHECNDEWYRDEHGLTCPECGSDFTEIIEENNDPRDSAVFGGDGGDGDDEPMPDLEEALLHQHPQHNPSASDDPEEADINNFQFTPTGPGRFRVHATVTRSVSPQQMQGGIGQASIANFMSMLTGIAGAAARPQVQQEHGQNQGQGAELFSGPGRTQDQSAFQEAQERSQSPPGPLQLRTGRFTYHGGARLFPRDANNAQPHVEPVDEITNVMTGIMAALGAPPGSIQAQVHRNDGVEGHFHGEHNHEPGQMHLPFFQLFSSMGLMGPDGNVGDFVYSQEGLDRIISRLMEQTATSNAPGPASQNDIDALPRKKVSEDMLGPEHRAECSICMDEVSGGEEVTELPCKHWFHHQCVSAWLNEHDTCPHCRKGISTRAEGQQSQAAATGAQADPINRMPGAFNPSDSGTRSDAIVVDDHGGAQASGSSGNAGSNTGNGGISDRIRRGLFGPEQ